MTAQSPEILIHRGANLDLCSDPLHYYLSRLRKTRRPRFVWASTACYRGYTATWEIRDGVLCLNELDGFLETDAGVIRASLQDAMPWLRPPVAATWFTGELRCPEGRLFQYVHHMYASAYERDRLFWVERGEVREERVQVNPPPPMTYCIEADGRRVHLNPDGQKEEVPADLLGPDGEVVGHKLWGKPPADDEESGYVLAGCYVRGFGPASAADAEPNPGAHPGAEP